MNYRSVLYDHVRYLNISLLNEGMICVDLNDKSHRQQDCCDMLVEFTNTQTQSCLIKFNKLIGWINIECSSIQCIKIFKAKTSSCLLSSSDTESNMCMLEFFWHWVWISYIFSCQCRKRLIHRLKCISSLFFYIFFHHFLGCQLGREYIYKTVRLSSGLTWRLFWMFHTRN